MDMRLQKNFILAIFLKSIRRSDIKIPFHLHMKIFHIFLQNFFLLRDFCIRHKIYIWRLCFNIKFSDFSALFYGPELLITIFVFIATRNIKFFTRNFYFSDMYDRVVRIYNVFKINSRLILKLLFFGVL